MTESHEPTKQERQRYQQAVDQFMDLLARLIAREHLRRAADDRTRKGEAQDDQTSDES